MIQFKDKCGLSSVIPTDNSSDRKHKGYYLLLRHTVQTHTWDLHHCKHAQTVQIKDILAVPEMPCCSIEADLAVGLMPTSVDQAATVRLSWSLLEAGEQVTTVQTSSTPLLSGQTKTGIVIKTTGINIIFPDNQKARFWEEAQLVNFDLWPNPWPHNAHTFLLLWLSVLALSPGCPVWLGFSQAVCFDSLQVNACMLLLSVQSE